MQHTMRVLSLITLVFGVCLVAVVKLDFFKDQLLVLRDLQTEKLEIKIEITDRVTSGLIVFEVKALHVGVSKSLINGDASIRVKRQHLFDQVNGLLIGSTEKFIKVLASVVWKLTHESTIVCVFNLVNKSSIGSSNQIRNHHHLLLLCLCR